jgi:hypothetical protein
MASITEDQKKMLNQTFGVDLDQLGESNYSVYHEENYQGGMISLYINGNGNGSIFSTQMSSRLICLVIHNGNPVVLMEGSLLVEGFSPSGDGNVPQT